MIVYKKSKSDFLVDIRDSSIADIISDHVEMYLNKKVGKSEYQSWQNSLQYMANVLAAEAIPADSNISIEYSIPRTSNRIDIIISGQNSEKQELLVLIELKQWSEANLTDKDAIVETRFQHGMKETPHPSYQAWSYSTLLTGFNETVYNENIQIIPCAFLHNYTDNDAVISNDFYAEYTAKAPVFFKEDKVKLRDFIIHQVKSGDSKDVMKRIEESKISPSKSLADAMASMMKGNEEFVMIDEQKIVYENSLSLARKSGKDNKNVLIVHGGPGTGKSVIAVNLLVRLTKLGLIAQYVTKNAAPRAVYHAKLTGSFKKSQISNFFVGSGSFISVLENEIFDVLVVDEAHRLNEGSGLYGNLGENQVKEIIAASNFSVFFLDEDQRVTLKDIGTEEEIEKWAEINGARVSKLKLTSQFRCAGSDGYLAWLDNTLQIRETANTKLDTAEYEFKVFSDPRELRDAIFEKNKAANRARLVAGYCWDWVSKKNPASMDIVIPEFGFEMQWNLNSDGGLWIMQPESVKEVGCIHTCQGLEVDYVGVIIGPDLIYRNGKIITDASKRSKNDKSIFGHKKMLKEDPINAQTRLDTIIKNTYRTLMSRGMKGCYVFCTDSETEQYIAKAVFINHLP